MYDSLYSFVNNDENSITSDLSLEDLLALCKTLPLEIHLVNMLINALRAHCIDGRFVIEVEEEHLAPYFPSQLHHSKSLSVLRAAALAQMGCFSVGAVLCPIGVHPLAYAGLATDMSSLTESQVIQVISADALAASEGEGLIYGQLLVLGYSERHSMYSRDRERRETMVVGGANSTLVLRRRAIAGTHLEMAEYDPLKDVFQIGRADNNDMVLRGHLHACSDSLMDASTAMGLAGPLSRYACRIVCDRLPPFSVHIFAAGYDQGCLQLSAAAPKVPSTAADYVTACGTRLWRPDTQQWLEISTGGHGVAPRPCLTKAGTLLPVPDTLQDGSKPDADWTWNRLCDGCVLDLAGTYVLFQSPLTMARTTFPEPAEVLHALHALRPTCPVLLQKVVFGHLTEQERLLSQLRATEVSGAAFVSRLRPPLSSPALSSHATATEFEDSVRAMVYPACGHVHGYSHRLLETKRCPLCRQRGSMVEVQFPFCAFLDDGKPTHVFNPCGHVASLAVCEYWAAGPGPTFVDVNSTLLSRRRKRSPPPLHPSADTFPHLTATAPRPHRANPGNLRVHVPLAERATSRDAPGSALPQTTTTTQHSSDTATSSVNKSLTTEFHICPFCAQRLSPSKPFSPLLLQSDSGAAAMWSQPSRVSAGLGLGLDISADGKCSSDHTHALTQPISACVPCDSPDYSRQPSSTAADQATIRAAYQPGGSLHTYLQIGPKVYPKVRIQDLVKNVTGSR